MAMRGRGAGRGNNASRPPRLIVNRVYEQFKPMSEWRQEDGYDTLLMYLPGFQKEYIKATTEDMNILRVRGERLVSENKWSRFQEDYRVPENCEMRGIRAKFDGGILTITMPRKITNAPPPPLPPTTTTPARVVPKQEQPQKPKEEPKENKPDKPQTTRLEDKTLPPQPKPTYSSAPTNQQPPNARLEDNTLPPQPKPISSSAPTKQQPLNTRLEDNTFPPQPKPISSSVPTKQQPLNTRLEDNTLPPQSKPISSSAPTKQQPSNTRLEDNTLQTQPKPISSSAPTKQQPSKPAQEAREGFEHDAVEKPRVGKKTDLDKGKRKEAILKEETKKDFEGSKGKPTSSGVVSGGLRGIFERRGMADEDRKLLVNVGVGVLIIAALGVHVSYTIGLIGKGE